MARAVRPAWRAGGRIAGYDRPEGWPDAPEPTDATAIRGIFIGCVTSTPFWLVMLAFALR